jgi:hypothetical protein
MGLKGMFDGISFKLLRFPFFVVVSVSSLTKLIEFAFSKQIFIEKSH